MSSDSGAYYLDEAQMARFLDTLEVTRFRRMVFSSRGIQSRDGRTHVNLFVDGRAVTTLDFFPEGIVQTVDSPALRALDGSALDACLTQCLQAAA